MENFTLKENARIGEKYYYLKHKSGLDIYVVPKKHLSSYAIIGTRYGASDRSFKTEKDEDFLTVPDGVAHFLEHKLFESEDGEDTFARFARVGGNANAFTGSNQTCYLFSTTENFYENLEILLDFVQSPHFTEANVAKEQGIIGEEIKMYEDDPNWRVHFNMLEGLYLNNPAKVNVCGTVETISKITPEILYRCYNTFYNLNNMVLCVCGDVDAETVVSVADRVLKPAEKVSIIRNSEEEPEGINQAFVSEEGEVAMPIYNIGFKEKVLSDPSELLKYKAEMEILMRMMFSKSSEFYNDSYESGLITPWFSAWSNAGRDASYSVISGSAPNPEEIFEAVKAEIRKRRESFFDLDSFERAKRCIYAETLTDFNSTSSVANAMVGFALDGNDFFDFADAVSAVSVDDLKKRLDESFEPERAVLSVVVPFSAE